MTIKCFLKNIAILLTTLVITISCASSSKKIVTSYVSPTQYQSYSCDQLAQELVRLGQRKSDLAGNLDKAASNDAGLTAVSILLFWPAAFALGGNEAQEAEYARLKGQYDAVDESAIMMKCNINPAVASPGKSQSININNLGKNSFEYYGQAEKEISSGTYDANLWARSLVEVAGEEQKRKAKYIELRANQLYSEKVSSISKSKLYKQPTVDTEVSGTDISGTYVSDIRGGWAGILGGNRKLKITFKQSGKDIIGTDVNQKKIVTGTRKEDTIKYKYDGRGSYLTGKWKISSDGTKLEGTWNTSRENGIWNLTKIK